MLRWWNFLKDTVLLGAVGCSAEIYDVRIKFGICWSLGHLRNSWHTFRVLHKNCSIRVLLYCTSPLVLYTFADGSVIAVRFHKIYRVFRFSFPCRVFFHAVMVQKHFGVETKSVKTYLTNVPLKLFLNTNALFKLPADGLPIFITQ